eukprot:m.294844 g.294844  ORF g.294844 m.294844 type:complete len:381 (+) comp27167_c2_seq5:5028-6170(+)
MYDTAVNKMTGTQTLLSGKYHDTLLEIDVDRYEIRAVEAAGAESTEALGPGPRAYTLVAPWTNKATGRSSVMCGYGYTTFEARKATYIGLKFQRDLWECHLLSADTVQPEVVLPKSGGSGGLPRSQDPNTVKMVSFNLVDCFDLLQATITSDLAIRKLCTMMCPPSRGRGALVGQIMTDNQPTDSRAFFTKEHLTPWHSVEEVLARFPDLATNDPQTYSMMLRTHPPTQFFIIYVMFEKHDAYKFGTAPPCGYALCAGFYGRYLPGQTYVTVDPKTGANVLSAEKFGAKYAGAAIPTTLHVNEHSSVDLCHYPACPARKKLQAGNNSGKKYTSMGEIVAEMQKDFAASLKECSGCGLVKYCCRQCQKDDWKNHKSKCVER